jgi:VWFA-related protein
MALWTKPRWRRAGAGLLLATVFCVSGDAQQQPQPQAAPAEAQNAPQTDAAQQPPVFRTGINFVRVDVIVTDKTGQPVADLKQSDFQVTEDNQPQTLETFKLIKLDGGRVPGPNGPPQAIRSDSDEVMEAARDDVRLFAIFLDDYHTRRGASVSVREPIAKFIATQLGPSDMVGLMYPLQAVSAVRMTRDHSRIIQGLGSFVGRKGDYTPVNRLEEQYANYPAETVEIIRNQVSLSALKSLINHMGSLKEGRKALILVSEGYSNTLPPQLRDPIASLPGLDNPQRGNPQAGVNDPNEERRQFFDDSSMSLTLREVWDLANKNNVAIYAVDPRGLPVSEFDVSQPTVSAQVDRQYLNSTMDTLRTLALQTDGRAIVNRNDLATGMAQIVRDTSAYYLLGYNSTQAPSDGKFHEIKVQVRRPGVQVRARKGYWALTVADVARALAPTVEVPKAVDNALAAISAPAAAHNTIRTWIGTSRGANGKTKVTFVWEPTPKVAGDRNARSESPARVMVTAVGPDGSPYYRGRITDPRLTFEADPGKLQLRLSVEGSASQVLDTETREIAIPDLTAAAVVFGTPQVLRARTARDYQQLKIDPDPVPVPVREFSRTERLLVRVPAYGPGDTVPALSARLLNRGGQAMSELQIGPSGSPDVQQIELSLAGLAAGEYLLEIKAGDVRELVGFRVTP